MIEEKVKIFSTGKNLYLFLSVLLGAFFLGLQIAARDHTIIIISIMGITALVLIARRPVLGLYLIAVITPLNQLQQFEFPLLSSLTRIIGLLTLLSFLAHFLVTAEYKLTTTELFLPISLFVFAYTVGLFRATNPNQALNQVILLTMYFTIYLLIVNLVKDQQTINRMFLVLTIVSTGLGAFGILQYFTGETFFTHEMGKLETFGAGSQSVNRVVGLFNNPNAFAYNYVLVIPLMVGLLLTQRKRLYRWIIMGLLATCILCLFLTFSRGAFLAIWVSIVIILFFMKSSQKVMISMGLLGILIVLFTLFPDLFDILQFRMLSASNYMSIYQRIEIFKGGFTAFGINPLIGSGTGNAPLMLGKYTYHFHQGAHNNLIAVLVETGLLGFIPFSLIFINFTKKIITTIARTKERESQIVLVVILASIWAYFVNGLFHTSIGYGLWWMILGLGMSYSNIVKYNDCRRLQPL